MQPLKQDLERAIADGSCQRMNQLVSLAHLLNCISNNLIEEASDLMAKHNLSIGLTKKRHNDFVKSADKYFFEVARSISTEQGKMELFKDMDKVEQSLKKWAQL